MDKKFGVTRSGYRYEIASAAEITGQADEWFTVMCDERGCWLIVQGGHGALAEHKRTVHPEAVRGSS